MIGDEENGPTSWTCCRAPEARIPTGFDSGKASREMTTAATALAIEAEWRKRAAGVVPAQPKARPEGQRPIN